MSMISLNEVTKTYHLNGFPVVALNQISLTVKKGEWLSILGPSGSGKSTLLNCMSGMDVPDSGSVEVGDKLLSDMTEDDLQRFRRDTIGFVFQDFRLLPQYSVLDNVTLPQIPYEPLKVIQQRALHILEQLGLSERANHLPSELSGGEQQRTAIARALLNQPDVLLLDEPTGNLDQDNRNRILTIVKELQHDGHTIILATHDPEVAKQGDREIYLRDGALQVEVLTQ